MKDLARLYLDIGTLKMSINWVMTKDGKPIELPEESFVFSCDRVSFALHSNHGNMAGEGKLYLSKQRLVFLALAPDKYHVKGKGDKHFRDFAVALTKVYGAKVVQPWFGPNKWQADVLPVVGGGLEPDNQLWQLSLTFKDGGVFDFSSKIAQILEEEAKKDELPEYRP